MFGHAHGGDRRRLPALHHARRGSSSRREAAPDYSQATFAAADEPGQDPVARRCRERARTRRLGCRPSSAARGGARLARRSSMTASGVPDERQKSGATSRAGAGAARSSSSATARAEPCDAAPSDGGPRQTPATVQHAGSWRPSSTAGVSAPRGHPHHRRARAELPVSRPGEAPTSGRTPTRQEVTTAYGRVTRPTSTVGGARRAPRRRRGALRDGRRGRPASERRRRSPRELDENLSARCGVRSTTSSCGACSPASTTNGTRSPRCTPGQEAPTPRTGPRCCSGCTSRLGGAPWLRVELDGGDGGRGGRASCRRRSSSGAATPTGCCAAERGVHRLVRM